MNNQLNIAWFLPYFLILCTACLFAGCTGTDDNQSLKAEEPSIASDLIIIGEMTFNPDLMVVTPGTTVSGVDEDSVLHTVESDPESAIQFSSDELAKGDTFSFKFSERGTYHYHSSDYPSVTGTIIVQT